ncbi:MAG: hypothetical protein IPK98_08230 [Chloracidobacterium sp.]|nr:hypothetical protein [Chloracidobacterium sp.]
MRNENESPAIFPVRATASWRYTPTTGCSKNFGSYALIKSSAFSGLTIFGVIHQREKYTSLVGKKVVLRYSATNSSFLIIPFSFLYLIGDAG